MYMGVVMIFDPGVEEVVALQGWETMITNTMSGSESDRRSGEMSVVP